MQHTNDSKTHRMATMTNINVCKQNYDILRLIILQNGLSDIAKTYCKIQFISAPAYLHLWDINVKLFSHK